ncbi:uncharacterized protein LOC141679468 [Apium graveolens]|uniref:uncharacterized protein LOC141679468 n=1 Tax=Apium graveolens TaxID=4045 RepID=UPI003D7A4825
MANIIEGAHDIHKTKHKKKSNFEFRWNELRRKPKWKTPISSCGSGKRTKLSDSGVYSTSGNDDTHENIMESPQRVDALGRKGLLPLQKCMKAMRMLAYGIFTDVVDDYVCIGESTIGEDRGFPGMMGSIDCMHWKWKNCPKAWKEMFMSGNKRVPTIFLEAVTSSDLWIYHAFFGVAGSNNDINVLDRSPVFNEVLEGHVLEVNYNVNGKDYNLGYYLTDGIYPEWETFIKTIPRPQGDKRRLFSKYQEGQRKDIERAFGVLQSRFTIVRGPT